MRKVHDFSLIELLVVIGIIAILLTILLPALKTAKEKGLQISCMSNEKQIGSAFNMYTHDYNSFFPPAYIKPKAFSWPTWDFWLKPYLGNSGYIFTGTDITAGKNRCPAFECPADRTTIRAGHEKKGHRSYVPNYDIVKGYNVVDTPFKYGSVRIMQIKSNLSNVFLMADAHMSYGYQEGGFAMSGTYLCWFDVVGTECSWYTGYGLTSPLLKFHGNGANALLADGHVQFVRPAEFQALNWNDW